MDRKTADKLIAVLDAEIALLQKGRTEILQLVPDAKSREKTDDRFNNSPQSLLNGVGKPVQTLYRVLSESGEKMTAKEMKQKVAEQGIDIAIPRLRQILHQYKGRLFKAPKRGIWTAIKQK
jgi:hypothetical protein